MDDATKELMNKFEGITDSHEAIQLYVKECLDKPEEVLTFLSDKKSLLAAVIEGFDNDVFSIKSWFSDFTADELRPYAESCMLVTVNETGFKPFSSDNFRVRIDLIATALAIAIIHKATPSPQGEIVLSVGEGGLRPVKLRDLMYKGSITVKVEDLRTTLLHLQLLLKARFLGLGGDRRFVCECTCVIMPKSTDISLTSYCKTTIPILGSLGYLRGKEVEALEKL